VNRPQLNREQLEAAQQLLANSDHHSGPARAAAMQAMLHMHEMVTYLASDESGNLPAWTRAEYHSMASLDVQQATVSLLGAVLDTLERIEKKLTPQDAGG
jgi:hypothetical protein